MALFDFFKRNNLRAENIAPTEVKSINSIESYSTVDAFNSDYQQMRNDQERWLERRYDFTTVEGINNIPLDCENAPGASVSSSTGTTDMYLRTKGFNYQKDGNGLLALHCLKRSNEIRFHKLLGYRKEDYYSYVRMLVYYGYVDIARKEKQRIDKFFGNFVDDRHSTTWDYSLRFMSQEDRKKREAELLQMYTNWDKLIESEIERVNKKREYEFVLKTVPELCPKSQGAYTRAKNTNSSRYQQIIAAIEERGLQFPVPLK